MSRILVVDDDPDIHVLLGVALESAGHTVQGTTNPAEALGMLDDDPSDLIVLDVMMPKISGFDLLSQLRDDQRWQSLPVLMLSAHSGTVQKVQGFRAGADDFISKPFEIDELVARIERMLMRRTPKAGLQGTLKEFAIEELLQNLQVTAKSGVLHVYRGTTTPAIIEMARGEVVHASMGELDGEDVLLALVGSSEGTFRFDRQRDGAVVGAKKGVSTETLSVRQVLMEAAWLEDELAKREALLPAPDRSLEIGDAGPPTLPEDFAGLPLTAVFERVQASAGMTTEGLLAAEIAAPLRIRLALALSIEEGAIRPEANGSKPLPVREPEAVGEPARESCDDIFGDLFEAFRDRGCNIAPAYVVVLAAPQAWKQLGEVIRSIPDHLLPPQRTRLLKQLDATGGGALRLRHEHGEMVLSLRQLAAGAAKKQTALLPVAAGVLLWLGADHWSDELSAFLHRLDETPGCATGVVVGTDAGMGEHLQNVERWRVADAAPHNLRELLTLFL